MMVRLLILALMLGFSALAAQARPILILHTNDLHSFLENSRFDTSRGGYARLKTAIDREKTKAALLNVPVMTLDGGDFLEGTLFYMVDRGRSILKIMDAMGYDAVAIGNHDWLMGTAEMGHLFADVDYSYTVLNANMKADLNLFPGLKKLRPYLMMDVDGNKIAVLSVTTDDNLYGWAFDQGKIKKPFKVANQWAKKLKKMGVKTVIALTHLGFDRDKELVNESKDIDLVIGGDSHTLIDRPYFIGNKKGRQVAIIQAGDHANYLGTLLMEIEASGSVRVLERGIVPITTSIPEDPTVREMVRQARADVNKMYGESFLQTVVGTAEIDLINSSSSMSVWNKVIGDSFKEALNADIGVHSPALTGVDIKKGEITREDIAMTYPRFLSLDDRWGWHIYHVEMYGLVAKLLMDQYLTGSEPVVLSGVKFRIEVSKKGKKKIKDIMIGGEPIQLLKKYSVAFPEGVIKGGLGIMGLLIDLLHEVNRTEVTVWDAIEAKVRRLGTIRDEQGLHGEEDAMFLPGR